MLIPPVWYQKNAQNAYRREARFSYYSLTRNPVESGEFQGRLRVKSTKGFSIWYGAWIDELEARIIPWLYGRGGRAWEDLAIRTLGKKRAHSRAGDGLVSDRGTVALGCIPLLPEGLRGFDVDRDPLVEKVVGCFTAIGAKDVQALTRPVGEDDG